MVYRVKFYLRERGGGEERRGEEKRGEERRERKWRLTVADS